MVYENSTKSVILDQTIFKPFLVDFGTLWSFLFIQEPETEKNVRIWIELWEWLWPFTKGNWKVTQKLVLSARNQKLNIATQIFPLTMYPIVLECFASLTWRNLLSYLCEKKKKIFLFIVFENHHKCLIHGKKYWIEIYKIQATQICIRWLTLISDFHPKNLDFDS